MRDIQVDCQTSHSPARCNTLEFNSLNRPGCGLYGVIRDLLNSRIQAEKSETAMIANRARRHLICIPVHNEEKTVRTVVEQVRQSSRDDILIIDDGSTDDSIERIKDLDFIRVKRHPTCRGYGSTMISAFQVGIAEGYDYLTTIDSDLQHDPRDLPRFIAALDRADIASGTRYGIASEEYGNAPADRRFINATITEAIRHHTGLAITDGFCGYKSYRVASLKKLVLTQNDMSFPIDLWIQAWRANLTVEEVPVDRRYPDPDRKFAAPLNDPEMRLQYYKAVLEEKILKS